MPGNEPSINDMERCSFLQHDRAGVRLNCKTHIKGGRRMPEYYYTSTGCKDSTAFSKKLGSICA